MADDTFTVGSDDRDGWYDDAAAAMVAVNADVSAQVAKRLAGASIPARARSLFREAWWTQAVDQRAIPVFSGIAADSVDDLADGLTLDLGPEQRTAAGAGAVGSALGLLDQRYTTVRDRIKVLHAQARREGWDPDDLADALGIGGDDASGVLSDASADGIGRSLATLLIEGTAVYALNALASESVTATKTWRSVGDERVRDAHADADGQTVGIDEPFDIGGYDALFPGDPDLPPDLAIGCRCALEYSVDAGDETTTLDLEDLEEEEAMAASAGPVPTTFAVNGARITVTVEPTAAEKQALAVYADVPAELHIPLLDVGDVAAFTPDARIALAGALATVAATTPPLSGQIAGTGYLETDGVTVGLVDCPGLGALRDQIAGALYDMAPEPGEFIPAIVLTAGSVDVSTIAAVPVHFNELRVHVGGAETLVFDLLGPIATAPSPDTTEPAAETPPPDPAEIPPAEEPPMTTSTTTTLLTFGNGTTSATVPDGWKLVPSTSTTASTFAPGDVPGTAPGDTPPDGGETTAPPAPPLADLTDEEIETEIARRAAEQVAADTGVNADDLMADALAEVSGIVAEIVTELEAEDPAEGDPIPPAPAATATGGDHETLADGDPADGLLAPDVNGDGLGEPSLATDYEWEGILAIEGTPTSDGRMFAEGALVWRTLPLTLSLQTVTAPGHDGGVVCGSICEIVRDGNNIIGRGRFSSTDAGELARTLIGEGSLHGVSIDVAAAVVVYTDENGDDLDPVDVAFGEPATAVFTQAEMMGAHLTPFPAFADARVDLIDTPTSLVATGAPGAWRLSGPAFFTLLDGELATDALVASAAPAVVAPSEQLFALRPNTTEPFQVLAPRPDGTIPCYGLVASWSIPHIGMGGRKVYPPRGDDFGHLYTGKTVLTREGTRVPTCPIFIDTVHPDLAANASDAQAWYAHTGAAVADVHLYEGELGIVAAGVLRPGVDELAAYRLRGSDVSPDWRWVDGKHRMVALLAVNASGFPVPMVEGIAASAGRMRPWVAYNDTTGEPLAMVAVGAIHREPTARQVLSGLQATVAVQGQQLAALTVQLAALQAPSPVESAPVEPVVDDGPVELSAAERAARARAAMATMGLDRESRARRARAALGLVESR